MYAIYKIECIKTNKCYVGQTTQPDIRYKRHILLLKKNKHHSIKLQRAWNRYGSENFLYSIIEYIEESVSKSYLTEREQFWIDSLNSFNVGYNSSPTAGLSTLGFKFSNESKKKISDKAKCRVVSKETRKKLSKAMKGRIFSDETKKKLSESMKKRMSDEESRYRLINFMRENYDLSEMMTGENNPFYGKHHSEEVKEKMSENKLEYYKNNPCSEELKKKRSENAKGENNPMYGKKRVMSEESRRKMSEGQKKRWDKKNNK